MRAVERKVLAPVAPVVRALGDPERVRALVATHAHEPLTGSARVHRERELLIVLSDRERARVRPRAAARVRAPGGSQRVNDLLPVPPDDRLDVPFPATALPAGPRLSDRVLAHPLLDERDQAADPLDHQVVEIAPFMLHRLAQ